MTRAIKLGDINKADVGPRTLVLPGLALGINIAVRGGASNQDLEEILNAVLSQIRSWRIT